MRMRKKKNLAPRMERHADRLVQNPYDMPGRWRETYMPAARALHIEIGCGKGRFTAGTAAAEPDVLFVAVEVVPEAIVVAMERCADLPNVYFIRADATQLPQFFAPGEADRIYLNFSDPWPSNRHAKRRLTHGNFLKLYRQVLSPGGQIHFKTDNMGLFDFSLEELPRYGFTLSEVTRNLHERGPVGVMTDYEAKFHAQGLPIYRLVGTMEADWREPFPTLPREARKRWLAAFAAEVPESVLREHVLSEGNYLWHVFTWGNVPCLRGDAAREALAAKAAAGADAYLFYNEYPPAGVPPIQHIGVPDVASLPPEPAGFDGADWYLTDREFTWTFVHTHELDSDETLGPFFCEP